MVNAGTPIDKHLKRHNLDSFNALNCYQCFEENRDASYKFTARATSISYSSGFAENKNSVVVVPA